MRRLLAKFGIAIIAVCFVAGAAVADEGTVAEGAADKGAAAEGVAAEGVAAEAAAEGVAAEATAAPTTPAAPAALPAPTALAAPKNPWRGSSISYGGNFSAISLYRGADLTYNPNFVHSLGLNPQWHFEDLFFYVSAGFSLEQELTRSDATKYMHQLVQSDLSLDFAPERAWDIYEGLRLSGSLRFILPTSSYSRVQTLVIAAAPGVALSKRFDVMRGLIVRYNGRVNLNWHRYTTSQNDSVSIKGCGTADQCSAFQSSGMRNALWSVAHGPGVTLMPFDKASLTAEYSWRRAALYDLDDSELSSIGLPTTDPNARFSQMFRVAAGYDLFNWLNLNAGIVTGGPQLTPDSHYRNPFFNRYTQFMFGASVDVDSFFAPQKS